LVPGFGCRTPPGTSEAKLPGSESWNWLGATGTAGTVGRFTGAVGTAPAPPVAGVEAAAAAGCGRVTAALAPGAGAAGCGRLGAALAAGAAATGVAGVVGTPVRTDAALCSNWETLAGEATCCNTSRPGTPGLVGAAGSAAAVGLSARPAENRPAAATAAVAKRFLVRDIVLPICSSAWWDVECIVLLKLLK
jgi:hypothetical protein